MAGGLPVPGAGAGGAVIAGAGAGAGAGAPAGGFVLAPVLLEGVMVEPEAEAEKPTTCELLVLTAALVSKLPPVSTATPLAAATWVPSSEVLPPEDRLIFPPPLVMPPPVAVLLSDLEEPTPSEAAPLRWLTAVPLSAGVLPTKVLPVAMTFSLLPPPPAAETSTLSDSLLAMVRAAFIARLPPAATVTSPAVLAMAVPVKLASPPLRSVSGPLPLEMLPATSWSRLLRDLPTLTSTLPLPPFLVAVTPAATPTCSLLEEAVFFAASKSSLPPASTVAAPPAAMWVPSRRVSPCVLMVRLPPLAMPPATAVLVLSCSSRLGS